MKINLEYQPATDSTVANSYHTCRSMYLQMYNRLLAHPVIPYVDRASCPVAQPISACPHIVGSVEDLMVRHGRSKSL